jgi:ParB-like chromosome segregation protein Spo0J
MTDTKTTVQVENITTNETIGGYPVHPLASMFPLLESEAFEDLRKSIREHGQLEPIITTLPSTSCPKGMLLDGRNRLRACIELGIQPAIKDYRGPLSDEDYILGENLFRRHLMDDQRMMIATEAM